MRSEFVVQQQDGPGRTWRTVTDDTTLAAATGLADELRHALDHLPHLPSPPVRVVGIERLDSEAMVRRHAAELLLRGPPRGHGPAGS